MEELQESNLRRFSINPEPETLRKRGCEVSTTSLMVQFVLRNRFDTVSSMQIRNPSRPAVQVEKAREPSNPKPWGAVEAPPFVTGGSRNLGTNWLEGHIK